MGRELLFRILWAGVLCVASGATVMVADTWYHGAGGPQNDDPMYALADGKEDAPSVEAQGDTSLSAAANVCPADGATDAPRDVTLNWPAARYPSTYDVYFGVSAADVNNAARTDTTGLLASKGQASTIFDPPGPLAYGQTYYWRVDEVNQSADGTIRKGTVRSFTVEPYAYPVKPVSVTASSAQPGMGPEKTIDSSGLTGDQHGTEPTTMWLSTGTQPNWIQYQFDKVYKFYDLKVWNSNQPGEGLLGFGAKNVKIEYCADGITWRSLDNVPVFAQAPGRVGYDASTMVNLGGIMAKYVRLTIRGTWAGVSGVTGLSEVRFSYIPVQAFGPQPANGATAVSVETSLDWRPGREAASHTVFFATDQTTVTAGTTPAQVLPAHGFTPDNLNFGTAYYWKVEEANTVTYAGEVWRFTTQEYAIVDDFESYNDADHRIYNTWIDGRTDGKSGSTVGYAQAPFAERTIVHGGKQALPLEYNNVKPPYYSEASRTFDTPQNWATHGADTLTLYYRGYYVNLVDKGNDIFSIRSAGRDIGDVRDEFHFVYKPFSGDGSITTRVDSIGDTSIWAKAGLMIRETLDVGSRNVFMAVTSGSGLLLQWRDTTNGTTANNQTEGLKAPYWVRITRTGNVFRAERSADGMKWTQQGTDVTIGMTTNVYVGMAVTSHNATQGTTAYFSNVSTTGLVTGSWQRLGIGIAIWDNGPASLYLTVEDAAGKSKTIAMYGTSATEVDFWRGWTISLHDLSSAGVDLSAVKKLTVGVVSNPKAGGTGMLYIDDISVGHPLPVRPATRS